MSPFGRFLAHQTTLEDNAGGVDVLGYDEGGVVRPVRVQRRARVRGEGVVVQRPNWLIVQQGDVGRLATGRAAQ